ncbi:MAG: S-layer homology domain-containing protein [Paenibacillaceae bacterium]
MNAIKKHSLSFLLLIALSFGILGSNPVAAETNTGASASLFTDVKNHWAKATIAWAKDKQIVDGYPDGTFRPDLQVSEAEFLSMFVKGFGISLQKDTANWSQPVYAYVIQMNYPVKGATDNKRRAAPISRLQVAEIITGANGFNYSGNDAIQYILGNNLSNGKASATISGYAGNDNLTRAEAIQFIKNVLDQGMAKLLPRPNDVSEASVLPGLPIDATNLPANLAPVFTKLKLIIKNYPGFKVIATADRIGIAKDGNTFETVSFVPAKVNGQVSITHIYNDRSDTAIDLAVELLKAQDLELKDDFAEMIRNALKTGKKTTVSAGKIEILIAPSPELKDNVEFWYVTN